MSKNPNFKYDLTEAAIKRIETRVAEIVGNVDVGSSLRARQILTDAMEPENFHPRHNQVRKLVIHWIREGQMLWLCADYFEQVDTERTELREAGRNLMNGIRAFGRHRL